MSLTITALLMDISMCGKEERRLGFPRRLSKRSRRIAVSYFFLAALRRLRFAGAFLATAFLADLRFLRFAGAFLATAFLALRLVAGLRFAAALRFFFTAMFWTSTLANPTSGLAILHPKTGAC